MFTTEHEFVLPKGYVSPEGTLHREGTMRLATAADEILLMQDPRVQNHPAYLIVLLLSRVVTRLGTVPEVNAGVVEGLFAEDLAFLTELYNRINGLGDAQSVVCPSCAFEFTTEVAPVGVLGYPLDWVYQEVAYLGAHVHWTLEELMSLDHRQRRRWVVEVSRVEDAV